MTQDDELHRTIVENLYDGVYYTDLDRRISFWNRGAERISGYPASEVVGQRCMDNLLMHVDESGTQLCRTMCPLAKSMADGREREALVYLRHRDGHRQPVSVRTAPIRDRGGRIIGGVEIFTDNAVLADAQERLKELEHLALLDPLTNLGNRRRVEMALRARLDELHRYGWSFGLLFIDVDRFKDTNDRHGHEVGDEVLRMVAATLSGATREADTVGRWGGEEFVVILAAANSPDVAVAAERIRALVASSALDRGGKRIRVTVSIGATVAIDGDSAQAVLDRADRLLYRSKENGRNRVTLDPAR